MRRLLTAAGILLILGTSAGAFGTSRPTLHLHGATLIGARFHPRERVRLSFGASTRRPEIVRTDAAGAFTTPFPTVASCLRPLTIKAIGAGGDSAVLKVPRRACMPQ